MVKMRVLSISSYASDLGRGENKGHLSGALQRQLDYASFMETYDIIVSGAGEETHPADNLSVHSVRAGNPFEFVAKSFFLGGRIIRDKKINCIITDNPFVSGMAGVLLKMRYKKPLIISSMADMIDNPFYIGERKSNALKNRLARFTAKKADLIRVSTDAEAVDMEKRGFSNVYNAPFYIDLSEFGKHADPAAGLRRSLLSDRFDKIVLYVGRFAAQKDPSTLVRAAKEVLRICPKTLFLFIGHGPLLEKAKKDVSGSGIAGNVLFPGSVPYEKIPSYYAAADAFCIASIYEGTCMALHEAAICGLPLVATGFAGARDLIRDGENGFLAPIKDFRKMAENLVKLLEDGDLRMKMGKRSKEIVKSRFGKETALEKHRKMYEKVLVNARTRTSGRP